MQMIQSVHNEQSDKKKPVQTKVHMRIMSKHDDMWLRARFFPLRKAVACPVPTHPSKVPMGSTREGALLAPAHGFSARDRKTRQNVGDGRTGIGQDTRRQVSRTGALPHYALCLCLVVEFQI